MRIPAPKFEFFQTVYHKIKPENVGMITGVEIRPTGTLYVVIWSDDLEEKWHYEGELTAEKTFGDPAA